VRVPTANELPATQVATLDTVTGLLPTMGPKVLHCSLHKYTHVGMSLDETYEWFRRDYCDKCPIACREVLLIGSDPSMAVIFLDLPRNLPAFEDWARLTSNAPSGER